MLDRFVDALRPDPPSRHQIDLLTRNFLAAPKRDSGDAEALKNWFQTMIACTPEVERQMTTSPRLADAKVRGQQLPILANVGLEALSYLGSSQKAPAGWKASSLAAIEEVKKPSAIVRFTFVDSLTALVNGVQ